MKITTHFENHKQIIENELLKANEQVYIAVAWINFKEYENIFLQLLERKIELNIICSDNRQNRSHQEVIDRLKEKQAKIKLLEMPQARNHMHHKFAIIDKKTIINGSFNWSPNATKSFENLMIIDNLKEAQKFIEEFKKLELIEKETIKKLIKLNKCSCCNGHVVNILVFSNDTSKGFETSGDIVQVCSECFNYRNDSNMILNTRLFILVDNYNLCNDEETSDYLSDQIFDELNQYINNNDIIHAIGKVHKGLNQYDDDETVTKILWKNKFTGDKIQQEYEGSHFDVHYDSSSCL